MLLGRALCRRKVYGARDYFSIRRPIDTRKKDSASERMPEEAILKIFSRYRKGPKQGGPDPTCSDKAKYDALKFRFECRSWLHLKLGTILYDNCEKNRFHLQKWNYGEGLKISPLRVWSVIFARCWLLSRYSIAPQPPATQKTYEPCVGMREQHLGPSAGGLSPPHSIIFSFGCVLPTFIQQIHRPILFLRTGIVIANEFPEFRSKVSANALRKIFLGAKWPLLGQNPTFLEKLIIAAKCFESNRTFDCIVNRWPFPTLNARQID